MRRRQPRATHTYTLLPYTTLCRSDFAYHNGNSDPRGFGHLCVSVPDIQAACQRFEDLGVTFQKRLTDGRMRDIAFIRSDEHTSELQSLMRSSYAVFCLKKTNQHKNTLT